MRFDTIVEGFLSRQADEARNLAKSSDAFSVDCLSTGQHFVAHFRCRGLVKSQNGAVEEADNFHVGIFLGANHLRSVNPFETLTLLDPLNTFHPNIAFGGPFICAGRMGPGVTLVDLIHQVYEILTYQKYTPREDDA